MLTGLTDSVKFTPMQQKKDRPTLPITLQEARAAMVLRGTSLHRWATERGYGSSFLYMTLRGLRWGPKGNKIVKELLADIHS